MKKVILAIFLVMLVISCASADGSLYYNRASEEFKLSARGNGPIHITYAFHFLEKAAEEGHTTSMFVLGYLSYQRQGLINKFAAMDWWDMYEKHESDPNPEFIVTIEHARRELKSVLKRLEAGIY